MEKLKKYPNWRDLDPETTIYGTAPIVGIGVYTLDRKFSWPDRQCTTKEEYEVWVKHIEAQGYSVPDEYKNAYVK